MNGEYLKKFLVGLGFGIDGSSLKKFNKAIDNAYVRVAALAGGIKIMAAGMFWGISKISESFEEFGYTTRMIAPAINKTILLRKAMVSAYKEAGINIIQAVQNSVKFNFSLAKTKFQLDAIVKSAGLKFLPILTKQMDEFRKKVSANMPKIINTIQQFINFVFKAFEAVLILGNRLWSMLGRVYSFLEKLHKETGGWSTTILAVAAAWKVLNLSFLASPIGMIITSFIALLALVDDFLTWQEGGDSLIDWSEWVPAIDSMVESGKKLWNVFKSVWEVIKGLFSTFQKLFKGEFKQFFDGILSYYLSIFEVVKKIVSYLTSATGLYKNIGSGFINKVTNLFGDSKPLGSENVPSSSQNISQETNIIIQGSSDPAATSRLISNEQNRVNLNMTRNMKGALR